MSIDSIALWHKRARPEPTNKDFNVQLGCHFEEIVEMMEELAGVEPATHIDIIKATVALRTLSNLLKTGSGQAMVRDRGPFLDALADQIVTSVGVGHCAHMNVTEACVRVNSSNWSKTVDGEFQRDANGKIMKPSTYSPPDLGGLY